MGLLSLLLSEVTIIEQPGSDEWRKQGWICVTTCRQALCLLSGKVYLITGSTLLIVNIEPSALISA